MDTREFVDWFERQVGDEMGCRARVLTVDIHVDGAVVVFKCRGRKYVAKIRSGRKFRVSLYEFVFDVDSRRFIGIERYVMRSGKFNVYNVSHGFSNNALFYVEDGVDIDVYELQSETQ
jgi:hypothetical protein